MRLWIRRIHQFRLSLFKSRRTSSRTIGTEIDSLSHLHRSTGSRRQPTKTWTHLSAKFGSSWTHIPRIGSRTSTKRISKLCQSRSWCRHTKTSAHGDRKGNNRKLTRRVSAASGQCLEVRMDHQRCHVSVLQLPASRAVPTRSSGCDPGRVEGTSVPCSPGSCWIVGNQIGVHSRWVNWQVSATGPAHLRGLKGHARQPWHKQYHGLAANLSEG
jgi:hypothetical protein